MLLQCGCEMGPTPGVETPVTPEEPGVFDGGGVVEGVAGGGFGVGLSVCRGRVVNYLVGSYVGEFMKSTSSPCTGWASRYPSESLMCYFLPTDFPENPERNLLKCKDGENNVQ